jgi:hypothetical protein
MAMQAPRTYVLRWWTEGPDPQTGRPAWRCVVEEVGPEPRKHGFSSLGGLMAFWRQELLREQPADDRRPQRP